MAGAGKTGQRLPARSGDQEPAASFEALAGVNRRLDEKGLVAFDARNAVDRNKAVCKHYLETEGIPLPNRQTIAPLCTEVAKNLGLSPGQLADDDLKQILSGLFSIAAGVGALRTHEGSAHGHGNKTYKIEARHARLAVHAAHTMTLFILET